VLFVVFVVKIPKKRAYMLNGHQLQFLITGKSGGDAEILFKDRIFVVGYL